MGVRDKEAQCVGLDREALGFFSPYQMCSRHSFVYSCFWVGKRRHLLNLLIRLKYFKSLYALHTTHTILGAPNFYYNLNLVLVNPTGSWHCQFLPVLKGWKILINSPVPGSVGAAPIIQKFALRLRSMVKVISRGAWHVRRSEMHQTKWSWVNAQRKI